MDRITTFLLAALVATAQAQKTAIKVGAPCDTDSECAIQNAICDPGTRTCTCKPDFNDFTYKPEGGSESSVCAKALNQPCSGDTDCFTNAKCIQEVCNCDVDQGYIPTKDSSRCVHKSSSFNSTCTVTAQCPSWGDGTICENRLCMCMAKYHFYQDWCYFTLKLGDTCGNEKQMCYLPDDGDTQHVTCNKNTNKCECEKGYKPSDDERKCKIKPFDGTCYTNDDCTNEYGKQAECTHNKCKCKEDHHLYNNTCCFNLVLGDQCNMDGFKDHCYLPLDGDKQHVECGASGTCQCSHGFKPANKNKQCISGSPTMSSVPAFIFSAFILLKVAL